MSNSSLLTAAVKLEHLFEARHRPYFQKYASEALEVVVQDGSANVLFKKHYSIQNEIIFSPLNHDSQPKCFQTRANCLKLDI